MAKIQHLVVHITRIGRRYIGVAMTAFVTVFGGLPIAHAEWHESMVGLVGGPLFPGLSPPDATAPVLVTWLVGVEGLYGVTDNLDVRASLSTSRLAGRLSDWTAPGTTYRGTYAFDEAYYRPEVGARYKVYGGYNLAPYIEANAGYMWAICTGGTVSRGDTMVRIANNARGHATVGGGVALDYRLANMAFVGVAIRYTHVFDGLSEHLVSAPLYISYYW